MIWSTRRTCAQHPQPVVPPARRVTLAAAVLLAGLSALGCPEQAEIPAGATAPCKEVGQRCEFAPGKLGSCVVRDDCREANCFVCQSQH